MKKIRTQASRAKCVPSARAAPPDAPSAPTKHRNRSAAGKEAIKGTGASGHLFDSPRAPIPAVFPTSRNRIRLGRHEAIGIVGAIGCFFSFVKIGRIFATTTETGRGRDVNLTDRRAVKPAGRAISSFSVPSSRTAARHTHVPKAVTRTRNFMCQTTLLHIIRAIRSPKPQGPRAQLQ